jgi:Xaa-Pro aminopeptidase
MNVLSQLIDAQDKALNMIKEAEKRDYFTTTSSEKELNTKLYELAFELYGIRKFWHKRIVRAGKNTLYPYRENPENLLLKKDDILFIDFGPVFEDWEADIGDTYVIGNDSLKLKLQKDVREAFDIGTRYFQEKQDVTCAELYEFTCNLAKEMGWEYGNEHCGHLVGKFPHENLLGETLDNYIHPTNHLPMRRNDKFGEPLNWIYEIHFIDKKEEIGGFFEQLLLQ